MSHFTYIPTTETVEIVRRKLIQDQFLAERTAPKDSGILMSPLMTLGLKSQPIRFIDHPTPIQHTANTSNSPGRISPTTDFLFGTTWSI